MKTYQLQIKRFLSISTLALLVSAGPLYAQDQQQQSSPSAAQQSEQQQTPVLQPSDAALTQDVQSRNSAMDMEQQSMEGSGREMNEPAGADNEKNWSWIGLLGLLGLFGIKRRHDVHDENYRPLRT